MYRILNLSFSRNAAWYQYNDDVVTKIKSLGVKPAPDNVIVLDGDTDEDMERHVAIQSVSDALVDLI